MNQRQTELSHPRAQGIDTLPAEEALMILAEGQAEAALAAQKAVPEIARGAKLAADAIQVGGRLIYAAAGSSGLMALADALELPGTFGIPHEQVVVLFAGGAAALTHLEGGPEDDAEAARKEVEELGVGAGDCLIGVTASGSTPYPLAAVQAARAAGAATIGIANNEGATLFEHVDVAICLPTPAEVIAGSTRMGAGTAQKIALNMLSTQMAMLLGHVHDGMMVNVVADNIKLRDRAKRMVAAISGTGEATAERALEATDGAIKPAVLIAAGAPGSDEAQRLLEESEGHLRPALERLAPIA